MKKKTPSQATSPAHNSKSPEIELMIHQIIDKRISDNEGNIKWLADKALKNLDLRISIYSAVFASALVITAALSSWLGWPQLVNAIMKQIGEKYVNEQIGLELQKTRDELAEAQTKLNFVLLRNKAFIGDISSYSTLTSMAQSSPEAATFIQEIDNYYTEQMPLYGNDLCMNEIHFGYIKDDSPTSKLLKIAEDNNTPLDTRLNALKNITMRCPEDKSIDVNSFCESLIRRVESPVNLIDRRVAIQCLCHISSVITPNTPLRRTMRPDAVKKWWREYKTSK
jgi:hypothetical protein